jgi:single-strand DNA-binding protein
MDGLHCAFIGRLAADAELKFTSTSAPLVNLNLAVQDSKAAEGETTWVRVGRFGEDAAALAEQLHKGSEVYVEGRLRLNHWTAADGTPRSGLNVTAWRIESLGQIGRRRPSSGRGGAVVDLREAA